MRARTFTDRAADNAKPAAKPYRLHAGEQGLFLRVSPSGTKAWEFRYKEPGTGKQQTAVLGKYPAVGVAKARKAAEATRTMIAEGLHPTTQSASRRPRNRPTGRPRSRRSPTPG